MAPNRRQEAVALFRSWLIARFTADKARESETATVRTAAMVMSRFRHRFDAVSRTT